MIFHRINKKIKPFCIIVSIFCVLFCITGCGKNEELETYKANMSQFFTNIEVFHSSINAINPDSETAVSELLSLLDSMDTSFTQMASLEVPEGFPGVEQLADEASEYMTEAVSCYHQAFESDPYDSALADVAKQNYDCANVRLQYIVSILHGNLPEEIYTYDDTENEEPDEGVNTESN